MSEEGKSVTAIFLPHVRKITFISLSKHTDTHLQTLAAARVPPPSPETARMSKFLRPNLGLSGRLWFWFKERSLKQLQS